MNQKNIFIAPKPEDLRPYDGTPDAIKLINERYLRRNNDGEIIETPEQMFWRVAYHIALADRKWGATPEQILSLARDFYHLMVDRKFLPNAPTLYNAGTGNGLQFSACFVLPIEDSIDGIFKAAHWQAVIQKSGGGTGFCLSNLRPEGAIVKSTKGKSSGPISFFHLYNAVTECIKQGGMRRGANMMIMRIDHPDILKFIRCKSELSEKNQAIFDSVKPFVYSKRGLQALKTKLLETQFTNFNISVAVTDDFMKAVKEDKDYDLIDPHEKTVTARLKAREVFDLIVKMAWETGDPGLWFIDETNRSRANPIPDLMKINTTNPCGEQPLFDFDVCNLGSINLVKFVVREDENSKYKINWEDLDRAVRLAVRFLDNVIELNPYPLPQILELAHQIRRIGLGVMGWADMLAYLDKAYASDEACDLGEQIMKFINSIGHDESERLATERGAFPLWDKSIYKGQKPIRNCTVTTIAPTGEIRILANCSGGIEPFYGLTEVHKSEGRILYRYQPGFFRFLEKAKERGFYSPALEEMVKNRGRIGDIEGIPDDLKKIFVTAHEINPQWHVKMQAAFQKNTDNGVSKTINLPNLATPEDIKNVYWLAYETGCLGITVFRDGCKGQVLTVGIDEHGKKEQKTLKDPVRPRPEFVIGPHIKVETPDGTAFVFPGFNADVGPSDPFEVFVMVAKPGSDTAANADALGRSISLILRSGPDEPAIEKLKRVRDQFKGIGGSRSLGFGRGRVTSLPDAIAKAIDNYLKQFGFIENNKDIKDGHLQASGKPSGNYCQHCGYILIAEEGCTRCSNCDFTTC